MVERAKRYTGYYVMDREKLEQSLKEIKEQLEGDLDAMRKSELYKRLREIEKDLAKLDKVEKSGGNNMLAKLYKLAYRLDKMALYDEAKEIEKVMKILSERVGLTTDDMVSLADHFDKEGDVALADHFDAMVKEAASQKKNDRQKSGLKK